MAPSPIRDAFMRREDAVGEAWVMLLDSNLHQLEFYKYGRG